MKKPRIGVVGCGAISGIYFHNLTQVFTEIEIAGVCDLIDERAEDAIKTYNLSRKYKDMHEMFADPTVDIILNLTRPYEHYEVSMAAIAAGKHVYAEKPLGATLDEGIKIRDAAAAKGLFIGGAPDTFLGAGIQTCRKLVDDGYIGKPIAATAFFSCRGHESWHPDPAFYYQFGGGPLLDMGPYYITALVNLIGPVKQVSGMAKKTFPTRRITSEPHYGTIVDVEVHTHIGAQLEFENGAIGTMIYSFDTHAHQLPKLEVYGTEGTLSIPDPNTFEGPVKLYRPESQEFMEFPLVFDYPQNSRGLGLADMAKAIQTGRKARADVDLTFHVLEIMTSIIKSAETGKHVEITSSPKQPAPMVNGQLPGVLD
ncbi:MAG: Gfo/Idh/MocA family oxidoreductase [Defluviitaleaceae bacterium]|nr:Gfo/Idh/MocA family oxidoreductase [Defluviitaleaceae bacterium]